MASESNKRVNMDVMKLMMNDFKLALINDDDMHNFFIEFVGPKDSFYDGHIWNLRVEIPDNYPYDPPFMHFANAIYHPNIDPVSGEICLNVLNEAWSAMADLVAVFELFIPQLLKYPNPDHPLNLEAACLMRDDPAAYEARVKEYCERYGGPKKTSKEDTDEEDDGGEITEDDEGGDDDNNAPGDNNVAGGAGDP